MSKVIVIGAEGFVVLACDNILLFDDHGVAEAEEIDDEWMPIGGVRYLNINDSMQLQHVDALPDPWVPMAYQWIDGRCVLDVQSPAWIDYATALETELLALRTQLVTSVDDHIAAIYARWTRFESEYDVREDAARAFIAGGCQGDPGIWVTSYSESAGLSTSVAAELIIEQASTLHAAREQLAALRMSKYLITRATTAASAQAAYDDIISQANIIAKGLN